jgi:site-specific DNA recombinase
MALEVKNSTKGAYSAETVHRVAIYCRVSTDEQRERQTIVNQVELATLHCQSRGMSVFEIYRDDGVTGTIPLVERPEGKRLVEDASAEPTV